MILVTGPTGNIGSPLIDRLLERQAPLRALIRDPAGEEAKISALRARGVDVVPGDLARPDSLPDALRGVDQVFLLTPVSRETVAWKQNLVRAAVTAGVRHVVNLSVSGAAPDAPFVLGRWHWQAEQDLAASGLAWTHLRPTDLARFAIRGFLATAREQGAFYSTVGDGRVAMVDEADVAAVAAQVLLNPAAHAGRAYHLTGPAALTYAEMAAHLAAALGRPVRYVNVSPAQAKASMLQAGLPGWVADFINALHDMESKGLASTVSHDVERVTGRPAAAFPEVLGQLLA